MTKQQLIDDIKECDDGYYVHKNKLRHLPYNELVELWNICCRGYKVWDNHRRKNSRKCRRVPKT